MSKNGLFYLNRRASRLETGLCRLSLRDDVICSSKNTFDYVFNSDGADQRFTFYYDAINPRADFFGASDRYEQNVGLGAKWYGVAENVSRRDLGAKGGIYGFSPYAFELTSFLFFTTPLHEWRSAAGNTLMKDGFDDFKNLYNGKIDDPVQWDITRLQKEQGLLQPIHETLLGDRWFFRNVVSLRSAILDGKWFDILNETDRINYGCGKMEYGTAQGCER